MSLSYAHHDKASLTHWLHNIGQQISLARNDNSQVLTLRFWVSDHANVFAMPLSMLQVAAASLFVMAAPVVLIDCASSTKVTAALITRYWFNLSALTACRASNQVISYLKQS